LTRLGPTAGCQVSTGHPLLSHTDGQTGRAGAIETAKIHPGGQCVDISYGGRRSPMTWNWTLKAFFKSQARITFMQGGLRIGLPSGKEARGNFYLSTREEFCPRVNDDPPKTGVCCCWNLKLPTTIGTEWTCPPDSSRRKQNERGFGLRGGMTTSRRQRRLLANVRRFVRGVWGREKR